MKIIAIIQARMNSTRLPGKVLTEIVGVPMLEIILKRIKLSKKIDEIIVATTISSTDDILVNWLIDKNIKFFRGSESDVLSRFYYCALENNADIIIRVTADDPLKDPLIIDHAIDLFKNNIDYDYISNTLKPSYPEGLDIELFTLNALSKAHNAASLSSEREHVTPYIWKNQQLFNILNFEMTPNLSHLRWTVDKQEDLLFIKKVLKLLNNNIYVNYQDVIDLLKSKPELLNINSGIIRNEGYLKSLSLELNNVN